MKQASHLLYSNPVQDALFMIIKSSLLTGFYALHPSESHHQRKGIFNHTKDLNFCNHSRKGSGQLLSSLRYYTLNSLVNPAANEARFPTSLNLHFTSHYYCSFFKLAHCIYYVHPSTGVTDEVTEEELCLQQKSGKKHIMRYFLCF